MKNDILNWLQNWYLSQCDGDWEHAYGIKIENVDNPGWYVKIDLLGTELESVDFNKMHISRTKLDWIICFKHENLFRGSGGPQNLIEVLEVFRDWVETNSRKLEKESGNTPDSPSLQP